MIDGTAINGSPRRFSQGRGSIRGGAPLAGVTGGSLTFFKNRQRVIREDGKIEGDDPIVAAVHGMLTVGFDRAALVPEATNLPPSNMASPSRKAMAWASSCSSPLRTEARHLWR